MKNNNNTAILRFMIEATISTATTLVAAALVITAALSFVYATLYTNFKMCSLMIERKWIQADAEMLGWTETLTDAWSEHVATTNAFVEGNFYAGWLANANSICDLLLVIASIIVPMVLVWLGWKLLPTIKWMWEATLNPQ